MMKTCAKCEGEKPLDDFPKRKSSRDGRRNDCKDCHRAYQAGHYQRNKERKVAYQREYAESHRDQIREKDRRYREENAELIASRKRQKYAEDPYRYSDTSERWRKSERGRASIAASVQRRRARKAEAEGDFSTEQWEDLLESCDRKCVRCGSEDRIEPDHIVPLAGGGPNWIWNIQPLCKSCNCSKQDLHCEDYRPDHVRKRFAP